MSMLEKINLDDYCVSPEEAENFETERVTKTRNPPKAPRLRSHEPYYQVPKRWLSNRMMDEVFDVRARLAIFLWNETLFGSRPFEFKWAKAQELGIARNKTRELRRLAALGLIQIEMTGRTPTVTIPADSQLHLFGANQDDDQHSNGASQHSDGASSSLYI
jgi:hypothetical protein